ncbi:FecR family protein [Flavobacterium sp. ACAM 123]|uniref:FecR family protein n=1 Tax=Flavobacterium sp. ACAM 123 TaxID=1189620 RepID=UPI000317BD57|nr:FecR family protein [Flavobacterium sp. ACAM 123]
MTKISNKKIIGKYLDSDASEAEVEQLMKWLKKKSNQVIYKDFIQTKLLIDNKYKSFAYQEASIAFLEEIKLMKRNKIKKRCSHWLKYAAIFIALLGFGYFFMNQNRALPIIENDSVIAKDAITLELENGDVKIINSNGEEKVVSKTGEVIAEHKGDILNYGKENSSKKLVYNTLTIPNGKKFQVVLSDGTTVHLNVGSSFKYPEHFIDTGNRQVYLLEGEAYFEVAKDARHPFVVNSNAINVRVLGTEFNLSSYPEDEAINTVLIEGAVCIYGKKEIYNKAASLELKPGYKASWDKDKKDIIVEEVDTKIYTAWKDGELIFKNTQFKNIIKKLERHFNVSIINNNTKLNEQYFDAKFDIETIEQVLNAFNKSIKIQYTIENNQIIIN